MFNTFKIRVRQYGLAEVLKRATLTILRKFGIIYKKYFLYSNDLNLYKKHLTLAPGFTVRELVLADYKGSTPYLFSEAKLNLFYNRLQSGNYFSYGVFCENRLVYYCWIALTEIDVPFPLPKDDKIKLNKEEGYCLDADCHPDFRGKGFHSYMILYRANRLEEFGKKRAIYILEDGNKSAIKAQIKFDFFPIKKIIHLSFFGMSRTIVTDLNK